MASTYTTNLGIEKIGTGEQSGTWGDTTNTNFDILDEAINGIISITLSSAGSSGSPTALPITDGASSNGRNKFIEFVDGGDLGGTAYVQLTPNNAEKIVHIRNSLSSSRSVIVFQGTYNASNDFEIVNGADVLLKFNGGGSGATVTDVNVDLTVTGATIATADINGGTIDGTVIGGSSAAAGTFTTFTSTGIDDNASSTAITINSSQNTTFAGTINSGDITVTDATPFIRIQDSDVTNGYTQISNINGNGYIGVRNDSADGSLLIGGYGGGTFTEFARWNETGNFTQISQTTFNGDVTISEATPGITLDDSDNANAELRIIHSSGSSYYRTRGVSGYGAHIFQRNNDGATHLNVFATSLSGDAIFYGDDGSTQGMFWDASTARLGIGTTSPSRLLTLSDSGDAIFSLVSTTANTCQVLFGDSVSDSVGRVSYDNSDNSMALFTSQTERMRIDSSGNVGIGTTSPAEVLHVANTATAGAVGLRAENSEGHVNFTTNGGGFQFETGASGTVAVIDSNGAVTIGTPAQSTHELSVREGTSPRITIDDTGGTSTNVNSALLFRYDTTTAGYAGFVGGVNLTISNSLAGALVFVNNSSEAMRIDSSGNVGIGTASPDKPLHVLSSSSGGTTTPLLLQNNGTSGTVVELRLAPSGYPNDIGSTARWSAIRAINGGAGNPTELAFLTNNTSADPAERMRIDSSGNVGIGATTANRKLELSGNNNGGAKANYLRITDTDTTATAANQQGGIEFYASDSSGGAGVTASMEVVYAGSGGGGEITFNTAATSGAGVAEAMRIDESGNVLIGNTVSPLTLTTGNGHMLTPSGYHGIARDAGGSAIYINKTDYTSGNTDLMQFRTNGSVVGDLNYDGTDVLIIQVSDERLKNNITDSASAGSIIDAMQVRSFDWNSGAHVDYGFVAQELNQAYEPATNVGGDDVDEEPWGIKTQKLIPLLVKEIQDLRARVAQLEGE